MENDSEITINRINENRYKQFSYFELIAIVLLLILCGYLVWGNFQMRNMLDNREKELLELSSTLETTPDISNFVKSSDPIPVNVDMETHTYNGFSILLPKSWYVDNESLSNAKNGYIVFFASPELKTRPKEGREFAALRVSYQPDANRLDYKDYISFIESNKGYNMQDTAIHRQYAVNGYTVFESRTKEGDQRDPSWSPYPDYISSSIYKDNKLITIFMEKEVDGTEDYEIYKQIVSSIKFL